MTRLQMVWQVIRGYVMLLVVLAGISLVMIVSENIDNIFGRDYYDCVLDHSGGGNLATRAAIDACRHKYPDTAPK